MADRTIGIDVSKEFLDAHQLPDNAARRFANTRKGVNDLIRWMGAELVARIVFEATGRYHAALERHLGAAGYPFVKVNPRQAKRFSEALGTRAKTDRMDAAMLARMGMALDLDPGSARPENLLALSQLLTARRALIKDRTAAKNRAEGLALAILRKQPCAPKAHRAGYRSTRQGHQRSHRERQQPSCPARHSGEHYWNRGCHRGHVDLRHA